MIKRLAIPLLLLLILLIFVSPVTGTQVQGGQATVTLVIDESPASSYSRLNVVATEEVKQIGYTVNGIPNATSVMISTAGADIVIIPMSLPEGVQMNFTFYYYGMIKSAVGTSFNEYFPHQSEPTTFSVHLSLDRAPIPTNPTPTPEGSGGYIPTPDEPFFPDVPDVPTEPENPDNPPVNPDTPGSDEPGSDEPYLPILPPAGSVYNLAGFIPLGAGALLLFLVFFWKRKVYRILKSHAKKHGEKPEKEHLKEIADAIIKLVRDEGRYPEWKKNSDVAKRLSSDIVSVLDEMNYARAVPRGALVAEIIKAARGRINRHRL